MATEKETLVDQATALGLESTDESGKALTIAELKIAIAAAEAKDGIDNVGDDEEAEEAEEEAVPAVPKVTAPVATRGESKYRIDCTIMLRGARIDPGRKTVRMTAKEAAPLVKLGHAVKV